MAAAGAPLCGLLVLILRIGILFSAEDDVQAEQHAAAGDEHVRNIEYRVQPRRAEELELEHVHNVAVGDPVYTVAYGARKHADGCPAAELAFNKVFFQRVYDRRGKEHRDHNKHPAPVAALQKTESRARIVDVHQLDDAGYERLLAHVQRNIERHPIFEPLVCNEHQDHGQCVIHR